MMKAIITILVFALSLVGCSRQEQPVNNVDDTAAVHEAFTNGDALSSIEVTAIEEEKAIIPLDLENEELTRVAAQEIVPAPAPAPAPAPVPVSVPVIVDVKTLPFRLCALMSGGGRGARAGLAAWEGDAYAIVSRGDSFMGYQIEAIRYVDGILSISRDGQLMLVEMAKDDSIVERETPVLSENPSTPGSNYVLNIKGPLFDPIAEEVAAGIDPNNHETWPDNYRGPAIERLLRENEAPQYQLGEDLSAEVALPDASQGLQFEATEKERSQGIDPNDPATWTEGYRGPGIERAFENAQE